MRNSRAKWPLPVILQAGFHGGKPVREHAWGSPHVPCHEFELIRGVGLRAGEHHRRVLSGRAIAGAESTGVLSGHALLGFQARTAELSSGCHEL
jgi:hypothetical protein